MQNSNTDKLFKIIKITFIIGTAMYFVLEFIPHLQFNPETGQNSIYWDYYQASDITKYSTLHILAILWDKNFYAWFAFNLIIIGLNAFYLIAGIISKKKWIFISWGSIILYSQLHMFLFSVDKNSTSLNESTSLLNSVTTSTTFNILGWISIILILFSLILLFRRNETITEVENMEPEKFDVEKTLFIRKALILSVGIITGSLIIYATYQNFTENTSLLKMSKIILTVSGILIIILGALRILNLYLTFGIMNLFLIINAWIGTTMSQYSETPSTGMILIFISCLMLIMSEYIVSKIKISKQISYVKIVEQPLKEEKLFCPYCGNKLETDSNFCSYCGNKLS